VRDAFRGIQLPDVKLPGEVRKADFLYIGTATGAEAKLVPEAGVPFETIEAGALRGQSVPNAIKSMFLLAKGTLSAISIFRKWSPDAVLVSGGYVAAPVLIAAKLTGTPAMIYLPDITPGATIKYLSRLVKKVAVTAQETLDFFPQKGVVTGYPVRMDFYRLDREIARKALGFPDDKPAVVVLGGSQGARSINKAVVDSLPELLKHAYVVHATGKRDIEMAEAAKKQLTEELRARYAPAAYLNNMPQVMVAADLAICRAGASTLGELPAAGLPAILVPYPYAGAHQKVNAQYLASRSAAIVVNDEELDSMLLPMALSLLNNPERLDSMRIAMRKLARQGAAISIARELWSLAEEG
jgi:UDP-N-acetylglucosamine--N-acetylmuramyl-(pentapeptide) pyrophosphoryl-undecaprenol N-acetylglucosamine transferase